MSIVLETLDQFPQSTDSSQLSTLYDDLDKVPLALMVRFWGWTTPTMFGSTRRGGGGGGGGEDGRWGGEASPLFAPPACSDTYISLVTDRCYVLMGNHSR